MTSILITIRRIASDAISCRSQHWHVVSGEPLVLPATETRLFVHLLTVCSLRRSSMVTINIHPCAGYKLFINGLLTFTGTLPTYKLFTLLMFNASLLVRRLILHSDMLLYYQIYLSKSI